MVVSWKQRFVFISCAKTASRAMHRWLSQPSLLGEDGYTTARRGRGGAMLHYDVVPRVCMDEGLSVVTVQRDETRRLFSLWRHLMWCASIGNDPMRGFLVKWPDFDRWRSTRTSHLRANQRDLWARADVTLDFGNLHDELRRLHFHDEAVTPLFFVRRDTFDPAMTAAEIESYVEYKCGRIDGRKLRWWEDDGRRPPRKAPFEKERAIIEAELIAKRGGA